MTATKEPSFYRAEDLSVTYNGFANEPSIDVNLHDDERPADQSMDDELALTPVEAIDLAYKLLTEAAKFSPELVNERLTLLSAASR